MKTKIKKAIFLCQITESAIKVIKCLVSNAEREFVGLAVEPIPPDTDNKKLAERLNQVFKKLGYSHNPVILSLGRNHATCRYLKIPAQLPKEIEKIIFLQAAKFLPYPPNELITDYQTVLVDREGYSHINLAIAHKDIIGRYIKIFKELKITNFRIVLSSYGLCNLYNYIKPEEQGAVMLIDLDSEQVELAITSRQKLLFSRYFKFNKEKPQWENLFVEEINKTKEGYLKEIPAAKVPQKIIVLGSERLPREFTEFLGRETGLSVDVLSYVGKIKFEESLVNSILDPYTSFASLIGLGLQNIEGSLNLLPQDFKEGMRSVAKRKELLQLSLFTLSIIIIWSLAIAKNFDNKVKYLERLKIELDKIAKEARPLEEIEERFKVIENLSAKKPTLLDIFYEVHQIVPAGIHLINFNYEKDNQIILRGQTMEMSSIFAFISQLEKSAVFKNFNTKVRYAVKKKTQSGEIVNFEIVCLKAK